MKASRDLATNIMMRVLCIGKAWEAQVMHLPLYGVCGEFGTSFEVRSRDPGMKALEVDFQSSFGQ